MWDGERLRFGIEWREPRTGGPFKPSFGLSGALPRLDRAFPLLARVCEQSIRTRFQHAPRRPLRDEESCSTASLRGARTIPASPVAMNVVELLYKLRMIANVEIVVALLPEMFSASDQTPRHSLLQRLDGIG
jgi:hypothetical protein